MVFEDVAAADYDRFMGRFSVPLADVFATWAGVPDEGRMLDVGSGPGALTAVLAERRGASAVTAIDPKPGFVAELALRVPGVDARGGPAEHLPFADDTFAGVYAELVVHFMTDAHAGIGEMVRVARPGAVVAACVWDFENARAPHSAFLTLASAETGRGRGAARPGTDRGDLARRLRDAGCRDVAEAELSVTAVFDDVDEWWGVHTLGVGSTAHTLDGLDDAAIGRIRAAARDRFGGGPVEITGTAWAARGLAA
ncbi:class I SAM-dependent methyltransferase [Microbacterium lacticum]